MEAKRGIALGNAIIAARSAAAFFADRAVRLKWLKDFFDDVMDFERDHENLACGPYESLYRYFPNWYHAMLTFSMGNVTAERFNEIALSDTDLRISVRRSEAVTAAASSSSSLQIRYAGGAVDNADATARKERWKQAVNHVVKYTNSTYSDTELKVEFERVYELDAAASIAGYHGFYGETLTATESMKTILSFSFLNKAAVFTTGGVGGGGGSSAVVRYKSYMYGSNLLLLDNDLANYEIPGSDDYHSLHRYMRRVLDLNDVEMERFIYEIVTVTGGYVVNCPRYGGGGGGGGHNKNKRRQNGVGGSREVGSVTKRRRQDSGERFDYDNRGEASSPLRHGCVQFTSFNRMNNSIQFTFNTHNRRNYYTANVVTLPADDFCTNDLVLKRINLSSVCRCSRPTLAWRVCALVTPINAATIVVDGGVRQEVERVVVAAFKSFRSVYENKLSQLKKGCSRVAVISGFLGLPIASYLDKTTSPKARRFKTDGGDMIEPLCGFHSWLRAYSVSQWTVYSGKGALLRLLAENSGRAVIVRRPVLMSGADHASVGWKAFVRYMTYEDTIEKVLRLTKTQFYRGYEVAENSSPSVRFGVAYARGTDDLIVFKGAKSETPYRNEDKATIASEQKRLSATACAMWYGFCAPSRLIVDIDVLLAIGFNPVELAIPYTCGGRTFEHEDPTTGDRCTVFCSMPLRLVMKAAKINPGNYSEEEYEEDEKYGVLIEETDSLNRGVANTAEENAVKLVARGVQVLYDETPVTASGNRLEAIVLPPTGYDARERYRETVHDITAYWPGVYMVTIEFNDRDLRYVKFAFFTGTGGGGQMTLHNLCEFSDHCTEKNLLPPPILNTVQSVVLKHLYTSPQPL